MSRAVGIRKSRLNEVLLDTGECEFLIYTAPLPLLCRDPFRNRHAMYLQTTAMMSEAKEKEKHRPPLQKIK